MLYAVIDIGSNAARLLFANALLIDNETFVEKASLIRIPLRLGKDVFSKGRISKEKSKNFIKTMQAFKLLIEVYKPQEYKVLATAAMREAENSKKICDLIFDKTGLKVEIITGKEEASIIRSTNKLNILNPLKPVVFIDVGGGSTEISVELDGKLIQLRSFKIGTIRLLEKNYSPNIWEDIFSWLEEIRNSYSEMYCVGSGGNINKLNKLYGNSETQILTKTQLKNAFDHLSSLTVEERMKRYGFRMDRADVIVPAARIYIKLMDYLGVCQIKVPKIGLADGMVHILHDNYLGQKQG